MCCPAYQPSPTTWCSRDARFCITVSRLSNTVSLVWRVHTHTGGNCTLCVRLSWPNRVWSWARQHRRRRVEGAWVRQGSGTGLVLLPTRFPNKTNVQWGLTQLYGFATAAVGETNRACATCGCIIASQVVTGKSLHRAQPLLDVLAASRLPYVSFCVDKEPTTTMCKAVRRARAVVEKKCVGVVRFISHCALVAMPPRTPAPPPPQ